jgi:hypothetical protein
MVKDLVFAAWAPDLSIWTPWVKPVLFAHLTEWNSESVPPMQIDTHRFDFVQPGAGGAIVVDLPAEASVLAGLVLAGKGFRPVPLYNALPGPANVIDLTGILSALVMGAEHLEKLQLPGDAPPAFLLDARRRGEGADLLPGRFDNRSVSLPTDFPSANLLLSRGIRRALLIQQIELTRRRIWHTRCADGRMRASKSTRRGSISKRPRCASTSRSLRTFAASRTTCSQ